MSNLRNQPFPLRFVLAGILLAGLCWSGWAAESPGKDRLDFVEVSKDGRHFVLARSGAAFSPWGFNYDRDTAGRLLEDYWNHEWNTVERDFAQMKALGANTVRVHLQVGKFMVSARQPDRKSLAQLSRLVRLAQRTGLYLDITGLGCYNRQSVPNWYNALDETQRWTVQARFWDAIARRCERSPAVFCYDLMNEPIVTDAGTNRDWTPGELAGKCYVQRLTLHPAGRTQQQVANAWVEEMVAAIRKRDHRHLVTVGAIPWTMTFPGAKPIFYSEEVSRNLDFVSVHFYPQKGGVGKALTALRAYDIGKPVVIEEMFPLACSVRELDEFIDGSRAIATGWLGFYWSKTIEQYRRDANTPERALTLGWLEYFVRKTPEITGPVPAVKHQPE